MHEEMIRLYAVLLVRKPSGETTWELKYGKKDTIYRFKDKT
jgi:hypothetical protein